MEATQSIGSVRVANEVIASIAGLAAREIDGVVGLDEAAARHLGDWLTRAAVYHGVRVAVDGERRIHLQVFLVVDSQARLVEVGDRVQDNVVEAVERMLGLQVAEVDIFVSGLAFED